MINLKVADPDNRLYNETLSDSLSTKILPYFLYSPITSSVCSDYITQCKGKRCSCLAAVRYLYGSMVQLCR